MPTWHGISRGQASLAADHCVLQVLQVKLLHFLDILLEVPALEDNNQDELVAAEGDESRLWESRELCVQEWRSCIMVGYSTMLRSNAGNSDLKENGR
jgi:hypothetical protein